MLKYLKLAPWILIAVLSCTVLVQWYWPDVTPNYFSNTPRKPYVALQSTLLKGVGSEVVTVPLKVYKPNKRQEKKIEKNVGNLPEGLFRGLFDLKPMKNGGTAIITEVPTGEVTDTGEQILEPQLTVVENKTKFWELLLYNRKLGLYVGVVDGQQEYYSVEYVQGLIRTGPISWYGKIRYDIVRDLEEHWAAELGGSLTF